MNGHDDKHDQLDPVSSQALEWVIQLTSGAATTADAEALQRWCAQSPDHKTAFTEAVGLFRAARIAGRELAEQGAAGQASSNVVRLRLPASRQFDFRSVAMNRRGFLGGGVAAAAAGIAYAVVEPPLGLWPSLAELQADYRTGTGQQRGVSLADGVSVEMNTRTSLALRMTGGINLIAGETEVDVAHSPKIPFTVTASDGQVEARQARFNIRRDDSGVCVTCIDGAVEVQQDGRSVGLQPAQQVAYGPGGLGAPVTVDPDVVTAWRQGLLILHDEPLAQVIDEVNRYRPGRIILANGALEKRRVNGVFHLDRLDGVIDEVRQLGATVTALPGGIILLS
ncbi:MAG TPA: FecR domain-containing protein [Stellaceae bacterium]|nr:FecR domain-containing protein [Stellaceae bacterium]